MTANAKTDRRRALGAIAVGSALGCGALAVPTVRFLVAPAGGSRGAGPWVKTLPLDALVDGEPRRVSLVADHRDAWTLERNVELGAVWLVRRGDQVIAWSTVCPHLGCAVDRGANGVGFFCPCHDSSFAPDGRRLSGPSPRDLDQMETRVEDGIVLIQFQRFRQGTPAKETV